jgi:MOSC domain-containing protein YiiM
MHEAGAGTAGRVEAIHIAPEAGAPMVAIERARVIGGSGIEGDRYSTGRGHWSAIRRSGDGLTLVEAELVESLATAHGIVLRPGATRRNVTVRGIRLDELLGRRFRLGSALLAGVRRCEPCSYLEGLLDAPVLIPLVHRAGIRVDVVEGGEFAVGDPIVPVT